MTSVPVARLNALLDGCGLESRPAYEFRFLAAGAWHDVYLATPPPGHKLMVVRRRKRVIYGDVEAFDPAELHAEYAAGGLYYEWANAARPGVCPGEYAYLVTPELSGTVETFLGPPLDYRHLLERKAKLMGHHLGQLLYALHDRPAPLAGCGAPRWQDGALAAPNDLTPAAVWSARQAEYEAMLAAALRPLPARVAGQVRTCLDERTFAAEPFTLVNRDVTPENIVWDEMRVTAPRYRGFVDPVPLLDNGTRFAAFFVFCYRFLLPLYGDSPRYAHHDFGAKAATLGFIAYGVFAGYARADAALRRQLRLAYYLHLLEEADFCRRLLAEPQRPRQVRRYGPAPLVAGRLDACYRELAALDIDGDSL